MRADEIRAQSVAIDGHGAQKVRAERHVRDLHMEAQRPASP